jgi:hypothetical protein
MTGFGLSPRGWSKLSACVRARRRVTTPDPESIRWPDSAPSGPHRPRAGGPDSRHPKCPSPGQCDPPPGIGRSGPSNSAFGPPEGGRAASALSARPTGHPAAPVSDRGGAPIGSTRTGARCSRDARRPRPPRRCRAGWSMPRRATTSKGASRPRPFWRWRADILAPWQPPRPWTDGLIAGVPTTIRQRKRDRDGFPHRDRDRRAVLRGRLPSLTIPQ